MLKSASTNKKTVTSSIYATFFLIGITATIFGPTLSLLMEDYKVDIGEVGLFVSFMALGRLFSVLVSGILTDLFGRKPILIIGAACLTIGLLGIGSLSWYPGAALFAILAGLGHGMVDTGGSAAMADIYPDKPSSAMNKTHMFFGVGCLVGPLISGTILTFTSNWRIVYYLDGFLGIAITLFAAFQTFPAIERKVGKKAPVSFKFLLSSKVFIILGLIMFIYSGVGHSFNTWISSYMGDIVKFSTFFAAGTLAIYNLGLTLGRFVCSIASEKIGYKPTILYASVASFVSIIIALFSNNNILIVTGLFLTGFFFAGLFPTALAIGGQMAPDQKGMVTGLLVTLAALGSMTVPALTGKLSQSIGIINGVRSLALLILILVLVAFMLQGKKRKQSVTIDSPDRRI